MPELGLTVYNQEKACHGYTLFSPMTGTATYLLDMHGEIVHRWQLSYRPGTYGYLLGNGHLLINGRTNDEPVKFGGRGGVIQELNWDGVVVWEYTDPLLHHDFCRMPNGNTMVLPLGDDSDGHGTARPRRTTRHGTRQRYMERCIPRSDPRQAHRRGMAYV